ncbi:zn 2cys6 transcription factor [Fusarium albosuccineum]|uniref:Zn 2cys6 transcription factor n=1 Tax=Fusarium albosuccineum TaxID=1237068 RepID=A0A8H4KXQ1_9HYPO|nr:zn 2cys6 transcription factor [Fusarium albosuccineum]
MPSPNADAGVRQSAPYGHACTACSKAKARCMSRGPGNSCERCHRMQKECQPSTVVRKRAPRGPGKRTNRLEDKLDDLVNLLHAQVATTSEPGALQANEHTNNLAIRSLDAQRQPSPIGRISSGEHSASSTHTSPFTGAHTPFPPEPSPSEADEHLKNFRLYHVQWLPLVYIPPQVTAAELQHERPFLWLNIRALCCKCVVEKNMLNQKIREILAQRLMVDLERSIDLLLGLLIHLGWVMNHVPGKKMLCSYSSLAMALVTDLRLDRPAHSPCNETDSYRKPIKQWMPMSHRTNEERRATLTCFVLCSSIASFLKVQPMRWTPMMEHALKELSNNPETPGDEVLAAIVKICKVVDDVTTVVPLRALTSETPQKSEQSKLPPTLYVKSLVSRLDAVHKELSPRLLDNKVVKSHLFNAYATINSVAIINMASSDALTGPVNFGRSDCVYACVEATKKCMDNWLTFTPEDVWSMSMESQLHFGRCAQIMYLIFMTEDPAWDRFGVRRSVDLVQFLERGAQLMESVPAAIGVRSEGTDFFSRSSAAARNTAAMWSKTFADSEAASGIGLHAQVPVDPGSVEIDGTFIPMDFDDAWMTEMFMSWDTY